MEVVAVPGAFERAEKRYDSPEETQVGPVQAWIEPLRALGDTLLVSSVHEAIAGGTPLDPAEDLHDGRLVAVFATFVERMLLADGPRRSRSGWWGGDANFIITGVGDRAVAFRPHLRHMLSENTQRAFRRHVEANATAARFARLPSTGYGQPTRVLAVTDQGQLYIEHWGFPGRSSSRRLDYLSEDCVADLLVAALRDYSQ